MGGVASHHNESIFRVERRPNQAQAQVFSVLVLVFSVCVSVSVPVVLVAFFAIDPPPNR